MSDRIETAMTPEKQEASAPHTQRMLDEVVVLNALIKEPSEGGINTVPFKGNAVVLEEATGLRGGPHFNSAFLKDNTGPFVKMSDDELKNELKNGFAKIDPGYEAVAGFRFNLAENTADKHFGTLVLDGTHVVLNAPKLHYEIPVHFENGL